MSVTAAASAAASNMFKYGTARRLIAVTSCKGGVGKSTVCVEVCFLKKSIFSMKLGCSSCGIGIGLGLFSYIYILN